MSSGLAVRVLYEDHFKFCKIKNLNAPAQLYLEKKDPRLRKGYKEVQLELSLQVNVTHRH